MLNKTHETNKASQSCRICIWIGGQSKTQRKSAKGKKHCKTGLFVLLFVFCFRFGRCGGFSMGCRLDLAFAPSLAFAAHARVLDFKYQHTHNVYPLHS